MRWAVLRAVAPRRRRRNRTPLKEDLQVEHLPLLSRKIPHQIRMMGTKRARPRSTHTLRKNGSMNLRTYSQGTGNRNLDVQSQSLLRLSAEISTLLNRKVRIHTLLLLEF